MILSDQQILENINRKTIIIEPFDIKNLGSNSYDLHLGSKLAVYLDKEFDVKKEHQIEYIEIPEEGILLHPNQLYLGVSEEYTETHEHVPFLEGKSSLGRLGLGVHISSPVGNINFRNHWTLEISCIHPIKIYKGMPIAQIFYLNIDHKTVNNQYGNKKDSNYNKVNPLPQESKMWKYFL